MVANPIPSRRAASDWSPNQLAKREAIVKATARLMAREGVRACTSRAISSMSAMSTSALHYYFRDTNEILDLAFRSINQRFFERLDAAAKSETKPIDALWATAAAYLHWGSEWHDQAMPESSRPPHAPMLWFEFQAESLRSGELTTVRELSAHGFTIFEGLLAAAGVSPAAPSAQVLYSSLLGASIRDSLFHRPVNEVLGELSAVLHLPASTKFCRAPRKAREKRASV